MNIIKYYTIALSVLFLLSSLVARAQKEHPAKDEDYKTSWAEISRGDDYITYTYFLENIGSEPILFYNFQIIPNSERYDILQSFPEDVLILDAYEKKSYLKVKVYTKGPALTWNNKFMRVEDESSTFPEQNRDYVYYWKLESETEDSKTYSYHLKNISDRTIKFYNFSLTNKGGEYYLVDNILQKPVLTEKGESIQLVKYNWSSGEAPSVTWYADWASFEPSSDAFCSGLIKMLEASKDGFSSIKGEIKNAANDEGVFFDTYYCKEHIDGANNEAIEDMLFFYQYAGTLGPQASEEVINNRFYDYKSRIESCLPDFLESKGDDDDNPEYLKVEYETEVDYNMHYIRLEVKPDYSSTDYRLELVVEEAY